MPTVCGALKLSLQRAHVPGHVSIMNMHSSPRTNNPSSQTVGPRPAGGESGVFIGNPGPGGQGHTFHLVSSDVTWALQVVGAECMFAGCEDEFASRTSEVE